MVWFSTFIWDKWKSQSSLQARIWQCVLLTDGAADTWLWKSRAKGSSDENHSPTYGNIAEGLGRMPVG